VKSRVLICLNCVHFKKWKVNLLPCVITFPNDLFQRRLAKSSYFKLKINATFLRVKYF